MANLRVTDVDMHTDSVVHRSKGAKERRVRFGAKAARALSRYLRAREKDKVADLPDPWLANPEAGQVEVLRW